MPLTAVGWRNVVCLPAFMLKSERPSDPMHAKRAAQKDLVRSSFLPKNAGGILSRLTPRPHHNQQKSPLSANNLARERITATHAFLRNVTAKTPQSCPKRDTGNAAADMTAAAPGNPLSALGASALASRRHKRPF
jgi:hypothetical protein